MKEKEQSFRGDFSMNDVFAKTGFWMLKQVRIKGQVLKKNERNI